MNIIFLLLTLLINKKDFTNCYLFSIIISIYNTGRYLDESIGSLINQTIGFDKIQIILINDGSTDNTENICMKYKNLYENNIFYAKISHSGVSKARNVGLSLAKGLYINFMDSDDRWDSHALTFAYLFFKFYKNVDIIGGRIKYFELRNNYHFLDYKFKKTRIVNLTEEYHFIQLSASSCFFRSNSIKGVKFEEGISIGEDVRFLTNYFLIKPILGIVKEAIYYYRKRADSTSAIQNTEDNIYFYFKTINFVHLYLINKSITLYNKILPFLQYIIAYDTIFRIKSKAYKFLDKYNYNKYCKIIENLLKSIEDKYILEQKIFPSSLLIYTLSKKYNKDIRYEMLLINDSFIYSDYIMLNLTQFKNIIIWRYLKISEKQLHLEGEDRCWIPRDKYFYFCKLGNKTFFPNYYYHSSYDLETMYGIIIKGRIITFDISLDIKNEEKMQFFFFIYGY